MFTAGKRLKGDWTTKQTRQELKLRPNLHSGFSKLNRQHAAVNLARLVGRIQSLQLISAVEIEKQHQNQEAHLVSEELQEEPGWNGCQSRRNKQLQRPELIPCDFRVERMRVFRAGRDAVEAHSPPGPPGPVQSRRGFSFFFLSRQVFWNSVALVRKLPRKSVGCGCVATRRAGVGKRRG